MLNGGGYLNELCGLVICLGVKILVIVDVFEVVMFKYIYCGKNCFVFWVIVEINVCDN